MDRLGALFKDLRRRGEGALIPFLTIGDPTTEATLNLARTLIDSGCDILELGLPFSDPIADGPTIQASYDRALRGGVNPDLALDVIREIRATTPTPIVVLTYYNLVHRRGLEKFFKDASAAGVDGVVIPDLPVEESEPALEASGKRGVKVVFLVTPTTPNTRLEKILKRAEGFVYLVALLGVTGARTSLSTLTLEATSKIARTAKGRIPVAVGFGISKPQHVTEVLAAGADGVIVGSALIDLYTKHLNNMAGGREDIARYIRAMKAATRPPRKEPVS